MHCLLSPSRLGSPAIPLKKQASLSAVNMGNHSAPIDLSLSWHLSNRCDDRLRIPIWKHWRKTLICNKHRHWTNHRVELDLRRTPWHGRIPHPTLEKQLENWNDLHLALTVWLFLPFLDLKKSFLSVDFLRATLLSRCGY